jgi:hypothetical protein
MSTQDNKLYRNLAAVAGFGTALTFLGHGMWAAAEKNPKFIDLLTGSFSNVLGVTISKATATNWVQIIGVADIILAIILLAATAGLFVSEGGLRRLATSKLLVYIYAWGIFWGFMTAASRVTAAGVFYPEVWDLVERAPNFTLPLVGFLVILKLRNSGKPR